MVKKQSFVSKLASLNKEYERVQAMREEAEKMAKNAAEKERKLTYDQFKALRLELIANDIDPSDLQFVVDACVFYKNHKEQEENQDQ